MIRKIHNYLAGSPYGQALFHIALSDACGYCSAGCRAGPFPTGRVYRSSDRSLTMQCTECGMQWNVTVHRIAKVAARKADDPNSRSFAEDEKRAFAQWMAELAEMVDDKRGRRKAR